MNCKSARRLFSEACDRSARAGRRRRLRRPHRGLRGLPRRLREIRGLLLDPARPSRDRVGSARAMPGSAGAFRSESRVVPTWQRVRAQRRRLPAAPHGRTRLLRAGSAARRPPSVARRHRCRRARRSRRRERSPARRAHRGHAAHAAAEARRARLRGLHENARATSVCWPRSHPSFPTSRPRASCARSSTTRWPRVRSSISSTPGASASASPSPELHQRRGRHRDQRRRRALRARAAPRTSSPAFGRACGGASSRASCATSAPSCAPSRSRRTGPACADRRHFPSSS